MIFSFPVLKPGEAAAMIEHGHTVGFSGFTPAGAPKAIPLAIAKHAEFEHQAGREFQIGVLTGALVGARMLTTASTRWLRILFTAVVVVLAVEMLYKGASGAL